MNSPTFLVYKESHRNKITCPPLELKGASVAPGLKTRPAPKVSALGGKRGRREKVCLRFWKPVSARRSRGRCRTPQWNWSAGFRRAGNGPWGQWRSGVVPCRRSGNRPSYAGFLMWIDRKDGDGVVAPVGRKEPSSAGVKGNFRRVVPSGKSFRQRGNPLKLAIRYPRIVGKDRHGRLQFAENIHEIPVGRERHMAGTCARAEDHREGVIRLCGAGLCIQGRRVPRTSVPLAASKL